jgi:subtilase family serine protease
MFSRNSLRVAVAVVACAFTFSLASHAEVSAGSKSARVLITQKIDETKLVTLAGNTRPEARNAKNDRGAAAPDVQLTMELLLKRSPEQEAALAKLMDQLHTRGNTNYHQWLTPAQFAESFGVSKADVKTVEAWLTSRGFKVTGGTGTGLQIEFQGTVAQIDAAFHTEIHNIAYTDGKTYLANVRDPQMPEALTPVVVGPMTLNTFPAHNYTITRSPIQADANTHSFVNKAEGGAKPDYSQGSGTFSLVAGDIQKIYNMAPIYAAGYTGKGETIGFLEDTPVYATADLTTYQSTFGLSSYGGTFANNNPAKPATGGVTCSAPADNGDDIEAELDLEMGIAVAPGATIVNENCTAPSGTIFGGLAAFENLENSTVFPPVISMSYGLCEVINGATYNASFNTAFQQGAAEGISIFASAGDNLGGGCANGYTSDTYNPIGLGVTGWGESPYITSVGGTDFSDAYSGTTGTYWSSTNSSTYESALSYIPEIPWNLSCAGSLLTSYEGFSGAGYCNSGISLYPNGLIDDVGGAGGFSTCYTGGPAFDTTGLVGAACVGIAQPTYQAGLLGMPTVKPAYGSQTATGTITRTIPDVSLFASNGPWGHFITMCYSGPNGTSGVNCTGAPSTWQGIGGTSASTPMMASIQALIDQYVATTTNGTGAFQGNANYVLYNLAKTEYGTTGSSTCNSSLGNAVGSGCVFYDVTLGDILDVCKKNGTKAYNCTIPSGTYGLSTVTSGNAFPTTTGYDVATGIGTVNAYNLMTNWRNAFPTTTAVTDGSSTDSGNSNDVLTATVSAATKDNSNSGGTVIAIIGGITFYDGATSIGTCTITTGAACSYTATGSQFNPGSNSITAVYAGNNAYPGSTSPAVTVTETDDTSTSVSASPSTIATTGSTMLTATVTDSTLGSATPTGTVNFTLGSTGGTSLGSCTLASGACSATVQGTALMIGSNTVYANYPGVTNNFGASDGSTTVTVSAPGCGTGDVCFTSVSHNFGQVAVDTAATSYGIVVSNHSTTTAYPFSLVFTPAHGFTSATNCPAMIAAGASCNLQFNFKPTATGPVSASWSLASEGGFSYYPSNGGTLTGSGTTQGGVSITTAGHNFGTVTVGTTSPTYGTVISNSTMAAVTLSLGSVTAPFHSVTNCGATLAAGASCNLQFTFTPTSTGTVQQVFALSSSVAITSGGNPLPNGGVTLKGTGAATTVAPVRVR